MVNNSDAILSALNEHLRATGEPVATTTDLVDRVKVTRRTVLGKLDVLEARGDVASKDVGRGRVWWPVDDRPVDPPAEPSAERVDPPADPLGEPATDPPSTTAGAATVAETAPADPPAEPVADPPVEPADDIDDVVDQLVRRWQSPDDERRQAVRGALSWLREDGGPARRSTFMEHVYGEHSVPSQKQDTWWTETVRPALDVAIDRGLVEKPSRRKYVWKD